jgi:hypothetical protein
MLMIVMVGVAATVILSTQQDLSVAGQDREALQAFYAAEYGVAAAKDYLAALSSTFYSGGSGWSLLLRSGVPQLCQGPGPLAGSGAQPSAQNPWRDFAQTFFVNGVAGAPRVQYRFCVFNDPEDLAYVDPKYVDASQTADTTDKDPYYIVIHGFGQVTTGSGSPLAFSHVWVVVGAPQGAPPVPETCYSQEGGCGSHEANGGTGETGVGVLTPAATVRGL